MVRNVNCALLKRPGPPTVIDIVKVVANSNLVFRETEQLGHGLGIRGVLRSNNNRSTTFFHPVLYRSVTRIDGLGQVYFRSDYRYSRVWCGGASWGHLRCYYQVSVRSAIGEAK